MPPDRLPGAQRVRALRIEHGCSQPVTDALACESPLVITLHSGADACDYATLMSTPGDEDALAAGTLFTDRIILTPDDALELAIAPTPCGRHVAVTLVPAAFARADRQRRHLVTHGGCGVCSQPNVEAPLQAPGLGVDSSLRLMPEAVPNALQQLHQRQHLHSHTGGAHAAAWCTPAGDIVQLFEDIGRHNALDKLIGSRYVLRPAPISAGFLLLSSRASYELVQKAATAGIGLMITVGAASTLAVDIAQHHGVTLAAFARDQRLTVYTHPDRLAPSQTKERRTA